MNDMRKLMETVAPLFEGLAGFKNIKVHIDSDDVKVDGEYVPAAYIFIHDNAQYQDDNWMQSDFTRDSKTTDEEYVTILDQVVKEIGYAMEDILHSRSSWDDDEYMYNHIVLGVDTADRALNAKLIKDVIARTELSDTPSTKSDDGHSIVFNIERPETKKKEMVE